MVLSKSTKIITRLARPFTFENMLAARSEGKRDMRAHGKNMQIILVAQCTCKAVENFARAPRDEKSRNNLGAG